MKNASRYLRCLAFLALVLASCTKEAQPSTLELASERLEQINPALSALPDSVKLAAVYCLDHGQAPEGWTTSEKPLASPMRAQVETVCDCTPDPFVYRRQLTDNQTGEVTEFYHANTETLVKVIGHFGTASPLIYDNNNDGTVTAPDLMDYLGGFGTSFTDTDACSFTVLFEFSGAWQTSFPDCPVSFLHVTASDEDGMSSDACPLSTFWTERVYPDAENVVEFWHN